MVDRKLHLYTIMPLIEAHMDEYCEDICRQYEQGVASCVLFSMTLVPEGDPPVDKAEILSGIYAKYKEKLDFKAIVPISALQGNNVETLLAQLKEELPEGPQYYPADQVTDHPERFIISELIREKALHLTREEVPHSIAVVIDSIKKQEGKDMINVMATIIVERSSQKGIIIGKQGSMMKEIGQRARKDIELLLGSKVYLELWVKVQKDWRNKASVLRDYGFNNDDY